MPVYPQSAELITKYIFIFIRHLDRIKNKHKYKADRHIHTGALKMQDRKMQDLKMRDQIAGHENAEPENGGPSRNAASLCS